VAGPLVPRVLEPSRRSPLLERWRNRPSAVYLGGSGGALSADDSGIWSRCPDARAPEAGAIEAGGANQRWARAACPETRGRRDRVTLFRPWRPERSNRTLGMFSWVPFNDNQDWALRRGSDPHTGRVGLPCERAGRRTCIDVRQTGNVFATSTAFEPLTSLSLSRRGRGPYCSLLGGRYAPCFLDVFVEMYSGAPRTFAAIKAPAQRSSTGRVSTIRRA